MTKEESLKIIDKYIKKLKEMSVEELEKLEIDAEIRYYVELVAKKIKEKYSDISIGINYYEDTNLYEIWFDMIELRENYDFNLFVGKLIETYMRPNRIYNFFIDYNDEESRKHHINVLKNIIENEYPETVINFKEINGSYDTNIFICIENENLWNCKKFKEFLMKLYVEYIWKKNLNILFTNRI